jgi:hypothetical protein
VGRGHRVGAVGGVPRGVRVPAQSVLIKNQFVDWIFRSSFVMSSHEMLMRF